MLIKVCVIFFLTLSVVAQKESSEWDLAVAISDTVELLYSNGSLLGSAAQQFSHLKALTFDDIRHQFVVSDVDQHNDTIYSVQLTRETDITPILTNLPDDVQGLAIDPTTDILYWTDTLNRTINYVSLQDPSHESKVLLQFDDQSPQDVAIDVCSRYIYWTNSEVDRPSIERASLDGQNREVVISKDLFIPTGIAVDHHTQRIFWGDKREGIYYRIESAKFDGSAREVVFEGTHQKPIGVAVDANAVYWTDVNNRALWKKHKNIDHEPLKLRHFKESPMGVVTKHIIKNISDCQAFFDAVEHYNGSVKEYFEVAYDNDSSSEVLECLNGGELIDDSCLCKRGFTGERCEMQLCHNYCLHGSCYLSSMGAPKCKCPLGFGGNRCERDMCIGFCLNDGNCHRSPNSTFDVRCACREGYSGKRCEKSLNADELCATFCEEKRPKLLMGRRNRLLCSCEDTNGDITVDNFIDLGTIGVPCSLNWLEKNGFIVVSVFAAFMMVACVVLAVFLYRACRRPRINKRVVVNKNVTPLTYRPHQSGVQQCEITIEDCCNMNVCDTPCYDPPQLRGGFQVLKKDEKKMLLANMENSEELY
ncbi:hypothetical protein PPYR_10240 [Photinus pyralis]|uniref:Protein cueball n=1 Tax=Photinus pyralis TaxID=7054 RepID=A0A5N4AFV4_PHOPY|nr:protein cueball-like isoform X1 [Photinus pyralis]KAB0796179.1 hypothetical protein PPYR_10240 [Photinus pyralis]